MKPSLTSENRTPAAIALRLLNYCRERDWAGFEPYDALNSPVIERIPFLNRRLPRLALTQLLKRSAFNVRPLLRIPPTQNPKALGLFLSSLVNLSRANADVHPNSIADVAARLMALRSPGFSDWCWGYNFPWQSRIAFVPRWAPNLVCTTFAAHGLLDAFEYSQDEKYLSMAVSAGNYMLRGLYWISANGECGFGYPLPEVRHQVHNANLLASALFCRLYRCARREEFLAPALRVTRRTVARQRPDGSWAYGEAPTQQWIDNFHTGFNLSALHSIGRTLDTAEFQLSLELGFHFYRSSFFCDDGSVRYYHDRTYPIDTHCIAQSIITLLDLQGIHAGNVHLAAQIFDWTIDRMWDERNGFFYYRILRACTIRTSYMRWTQAWMLLALSRMCLDRAAVAQPSTQVQCEIV